MIKSLAMFLMVCLVLAFSTATAMDVVVPGDDGGDNIISNLEMDLAQGSYDDGKITSDQLEEIRHIYENYPITVTDSVGRNVTLYRPVKSVGCTISHHIETLRSLKVPGDLVIAGPEGLDDYSFMTEFGDVPSIGHFYMPDEEKIVEINPDLLIIHPGSGSGQFGSFFGPFLENMEAAGINVACFACSNPETYVEEVETLGILLEKEGEAEEFIEFYEGVLNSIQEKTKTLPVESRPKVYCENRPYWTSSLDANPIDMAGGCYIFSEAEAVSDVDPEFVVASNPEFIIRILGDEDYNGRMTDDTEKLDGIIDEIVKRPELQNVKAVQEENVYLVSSPLWTYMPYSGCRHFIGVAYLAKCFHPQIFQDIDPKAIHEQYLTEFQGLDWDLDQQGIFVYPLID